MEKENHTNELILAVVIDIAEILRKSTYWRKPEELQTPQFVTANGKGKTPEHVDVPEICTILKISKGTFYNNVYLQLLDPVITIGKRHYYLLEEVYDLLRRKTETRLPFRKLNPTCVTCFDPKCEGCISKAA